MDSFAKEATDAAFRALTRYVNKRFGDGSAFYYCFDGTFRGHPSVSVVRIQVDGKCYTRPICW